MFPSTVSPDRSPDRSTHSVRTSSPPGRPTRRSAAGWLRDTADLAIALLTLESYGLTDLLPQRDPVSSPGLRPEEAPRTAAADHFVARRESIGDVSPTARAPRDAAPTGISGDNSPSARAPREATPAGISGDVSPSTKRLPAAARRDRLVASRPRRPGGVIVREQLCLAPLQHAVVPTDTESVLRRRSASQDAAL